MIEIPKDIRVVCCNEVHTLASVNGILCDKELLELLRRAEAYPKLVDLLKFLAQPWNNVKVKSHPKYQEWYLIDEVIDFNKWLIKQALKEADNETV